jgi:hypothetical protein
MGSAEVKGSPVAVCAVASEGQLPSVCGERRKQRLETCEIGGGRSRSI